MGRTRSGRFDGKLTPLAVRRLRAGLHADGGGLYLRVSDGGGRSWLLIVFIGGRRREMGLGPTSTYTLADARQRAREYRKLIDQGIDPIEYRRNERAVNDRARATRKTFKECAEEYIRLHAKQWRSDKHAAQWTATLEGYAYPIIGNFDVSSIGKTDVLRVLEQRDTPETPTLWESKTETASRVRQRVRAILEWAASRDYRRGHDPEMWRQIDRALPKAAKLKRVAHFEACPYAEVPAVLRAVWASTAGLPVRIAFLFTVLTAARSGEVRGAAWAEIDLDAKTWTIPGARMKANRDHRVPLSDAAMDLLKLLPRDGDLVFPTSKGTPYSDMVFTALLRRLNRPETMHGYRSSFRDWAGEQTNYPREVVEMALAHVIESKTEAAYARSDLFDKRRELMTAWANYCTW